MATIYSGTGIRSDDKDSARATGGPIYSKQDLKLNWRSRPLDVIEYPPSLNRR